MDSSTRSSSFRMCVAYGKRRALSGLHNATNSSRLAKAPGVYSNPDDAPQAPAARALSTNAVMRASSTVVAGRSSSPTTWPRMLPSPTMHATFTAGLSAPSDVSHFAKLSGPSTPLELPSCPPTIVVTPWRMTDSARGSLESELSPCEWMSMKPGDTVRLRASISILPRSVIRGAIAAMRPFRIARSRGAPAVPVPS